MYCGKHTLIHRGFEAEAGWQQSHGAVFRKPRHYAKVGRRERAAHWVRLHKTRYAYNRTEINVYACNKKHYSGRLDYAPVTN